MRPFVRRLGERGRRNAAGTGGSGATTTRKFTAPTLELEDVYFTWGTAKDATKFEDMASQLARHVGTRSWPHSLVAWRGMSTIETPMFEEPERPVRKYWVNNTRM